MKAYIAVGGIGCSILMNLQKNEHIENNCCFYVDTNNYSLIQNSENNKLHMYQLGDISSGVSEGSGVFRNIGKQIANYEILSNKMFEFFKPIKEMSDVEFVFVTSSFGGTGSGAVFEIAEYVQALLWLPNHNKCTDCTVIAFSHNCFPFLEHSPKLLKDIFEMNTIQMVMEASAKNKIIKDNTNAKFNTTIFNPTYDLKLLDSTTYEFEELYKILRLSKTELNALDKKSKYTVKPKSSNPEVFISYSSADQDIADLVTDALAGNGINTWIASRSIVEGSYAKQIIQGINGAKVFVVLLSKNSISSQHVKNEIDRVFSRLNDGMIMIPFIIEKCELDEESEYYLCRQEMLDGSNPPITQKISDLAMRIKNCLE